MILQLMEQMSICKIYERTTRECADYFCAYIIEIYGQIYLRKPNAHDIEQLYVAHGERHEFLGMLGSLNCTQGMTKLSQCLAMLVHTG